MTEIHYTKLHWQSHLLCLLASNCQLVALNKFLGFADIITYLITDKLISQLKLQIIENTTLIHRDSRLTLGHSIEQITIEFRNLILNFTKVLS